jgi:hypothetical protein
MTRQVRLSAIERKAKGLLEKESYAVTPMRHCFITRYKPVNLMARRNQRELLYLKLRVTGLPLKDAAEVETFCEDDILIFHRLFPVRAGPVDLRFAIWILHEGSGFSRYEVFDGEIRDAGLAGNKSHLPCNFSPALIRAQGSAKGCRKGTGRQSPAQLLKTRGDMSRPLAGIGGLQP